MSIYTELKKAIDNRDIEAWIKIYHDDFIFVRHQSGTKMNREEFLEMGEKMMSNKALTFNNNRCIYENYFTCCKSVVREYRIFICQK